MNTRKLLPLATLLACSVAFAATAATPVASDTAVGAHGSAHHDMNRPGPGFRGDRMVLDGPFMGAIQQLNLTTQQQSTIHGYLETARQQVVASRKSQSNMDALANPGDANYVSAIAAAKAAAVSRIQQCSELQVQIYGLLTPEQQAKLPQVLADMKAKHLQHQSESKQHRETAPATN